MSPVVRSTPIKGTDTIRHEVWCPGCEGRHAWQTADGPHPKGPTWDYDGNPERPTVSPSLLVMYGGLSGDRRCHSFIQNGQWQFLGDSTHTLAGQTVPMVQIEEWPVTN